jgi:hypothetical protein
MPDLNPIGGYCILLILEDILNPLIFERDFNSPLAFFGRKLRCGSVCDDESLNVC